MRAAIYARVSTQEQAKEGTSLDIQVARCRAYAEAREWDVVEEFVDEGVSGSLDRRPALDRLMAMARGGDVDVVLVSKFDRWTRSRRHLENSMWALDQLGVDFASISEAVDSTTPQGEAFRALLGVFAELERKMITERMVSGQEAVARAGGTAGGPPPFGYRIAERDRLKVLEIDEDEAEVIRMAVDLVVDHGCTPYAAADRLNALGLGPRKASRWDYPNLRWLLVSKTIAGTWHRGDIEIQIPAVIDEDRWDLLQASLERNGRAKQPNREYPLSGHVSSPCGDSMTGLWRKDTLRRYYRCSGTNWSKREGRPSCGCRSIPADDLETVVQEQLTGLLTEPERLLAIAEEYLKTRSAEYGAERDQLASIDGKISNLEKAITVEAAKLLRNGMSAEQVRTIVTQLEDELSQLRQHRRQLEAWRSESSGTSKAVTGLWEVAEIAHARLGSLDAGEWEEVFDLLDIRVEVLEGPTRSKPAQIRIEGVVPELIAEPLRDPQTVELKHPFVQVTVTQPVPFYLEVAVA
jgi:DNA invertase Pin-like site-specific DNA recombinase